MLSIDSGNGLVCEARQIVSPNYDDRPPECDPNLIVIHGISLPPGEFGGPWIDQLFTNMLDSDEHPYFREVADMRVSTHLLIRRDGELVQYVPLSKRAWHCGDSCHEGRDRCNDFSVGIELEGTDDAAYADEQYEQLASVIIALGHAFPSLEKAAIVGHCDIAEGRKTDPGPSFDWPRLRSLLKDSD